MTTRTELQRIILGLKRNEERILATYKDRKESYLQRQKLKFYLKVIREALKEIRLETNH